MRSGCEGAVSLISPATLDEQFRLARINRHLHGTADVDLPGISGSVGNSGL